MKRYKVVELTTNIMKINGLQFLTVISRYIMFRSGEYLTSTKKEIHLTVIQNINQVYALRGFVVRYIYMDGAFECLWNDLTDM